MFTVSSALGVETTVSYQHEVQVQLDCSSVCFVRQIGPARAQPILTRPSAAKRHSSGRQHISEPSAGRHCEAELSLSYNSKFQYSLGCIMRLHLKTSKTKQTKIKNTFHMYSFCAIM